MVQPGNNFWERALEKVACFSCWEDGNQWAVNAHPSFSPVLSAACSPLSLQCSGIDKVISVPQQHFTVPVLKIE